MFTILLDKKTLIITKDLYIGGDEVGIRLNLIHKYINWREYTFTIQLGAMFTLFKKVTDICLTILNR